MLRFPFGLLAILASLTLAPLATGCASAPTAGPSQDAFDRCTGDLARAQADLARAQGDLAFAQRRLGNYASLIDRLRKAFGDDKLALTIRNGFLVLQLPNDVLFDSGKATLKTEGQDTLAKVAGVLAEESTRRFIIAGHTDNVAISAKAAGLKSNWQLSQMRALSATEFLITKGVAATQLSAAGYGEFLPTADNATDDGKAKNRRIEVIFMPTLDEIPNIPADLVSSADEG
ncbi:MAG: hypothetical protein CVU56_12830 [Deltaproteobacteria bacterium HGW-Deltaproteobacteria-14]|jgi:chemotaxis protein MotB|nr:MAG: hypothetical protein CVU56_12830 [Deltaproteobacteria bacterium HGW-Deltaproteobacteria-14]